MISVERCFISSMRDFFWKKVIFLRFFTKKIRFLDFLTFLTIFGFLGVFMDFFGFFWILWIFFWIFWTYWIFGFFEFFWNFWVFFGDFFSFYGFCLKLLRLLLKVTKVTTGHHKFPKMGQHRIISSFFARRSKQTSAIGRSPQQELEVGPLLILILVIKLSVSHPLMYAQLFQLPNQIYIQPRGCFKLIVN